MEKLQSLIIENSLPSLSPTYICIVLLVGSSSISLSFTFQDTNFREPLTKWDDDDLEKHNIRYYNQDIHRASFVLPTFAKRVSLKSISNCDLLLLNILMTQVFTLGWFGGSFYRHCWPSQDCGSKECTWESSQGSFHKYTLKITCHNVYTVFKSLVICKWG